MCEKKSRYQLACCRSSGGSGTDFGHGEICGKINDLWQETRVSSPASSSATHTQVSLTLDTKNNADKNRTTLAGLFMLPPWLQISLLKKV